MKAHELNGTAHGEDIKEQFKKCMALVGKYIGGSFIQVRYSLVRQLRGDGTAALALSYLMNQFRMKSRDKADRRKLFKNDLWFLSMGKTLQMKMGMTQERRQRALLTLEDAGYIEVKRAAGNKTWIKIVTERLESGEVVPKKSGRNRESQKPGKSSSSAGESPALAQGKVQRSYTKNPINNLKKNCRPSKADSARNGSHLNGGKTKADLFHRDCARDLFDELVKRRHSNRRSKWESWANDFKLLEDDFSREEIEAVLNRYLVDMDESYMPQAWCGDSFRKKFPKIRAAFDRIDRAKAREQAERSKIDGSDYKGH